MRDHLLGLSLVLLLGACDGILEPGGARLVEAEVGVLPDPPAPPPAVEAGPVLLSASARAWPGDGEPALLAWSVVARNATADSLGREQLCVLQLRVYADTLGADRPSWRSPRTPSQRCPPAVVPGMIPPGGQYYLAPIGGQSFARVADVLGDSLPAGRYDVRVLVRVGGDTLSIPAGRIALATESRRATRDPVAMRYAVETRVEGVAPRELVTRVAVTNPTDRPAALAYGACALRLRAYRSAARAGPPVWRSEDRRPAGSDDGYVCLAYLAGSTLLPGETLHAPEFTARIPLHEVLGDSLPDDRYYFTADLVFQRDAGDAQGEMVVRFAAGDAHLTSRVDPLPSEREVNGVRYRASSSLDASGGSLRVALHVTNRRAERVLLVGAPGTCPTFLLGYGDAARRDRWYATHQADWTTPSCPLRIPPTWLAPGETRTFSGSVPAGSGSAPRHYHLLLGVWTELEPGGRGARVMLSAGEATLAP